MVYACWRGLSNRPARGAFISRSGSGDCGVQVRGKPYRGLVAQGRVGPFGVIVGDPGSDQVAGMGDVAEQGLVQKLVPHPAVEAFDEPVLHRLARRNVMPLNLTGGLPRQHRLTGHLGAIVANNKMRLAVGVDELIQLPCHPFAGDRRIGHQRQTLTAEDPVRHLADALCGV